MYDKIWSPLKQEFVETLSYEGKNALTMYINSFKTGGANQKKLQTAIDALNNAALNSTDAGKIRTAGNALISLANNQTLSAIKNLQKFTEYTKYFKSLTDSTIGDGWVDSILKGDELLYNSIINNIPTVNEEELKNKISEFHSFLKENDFVLRIGVNSEQ